MTTIAQQFELATLNADSLLVGIECEIEAVKNWSGGFPEQEVQITEDGSLRNSGKEFITVPLDVPRTVETFKKLHASLICGEDKFSERTSIHVHANCTNIPVQECRNVVLQYALFEEFFFLMTHPSRRNNIHCVPLTETYLPSLYNRPLIDMHNKWHKYTALNIKPLGRFGTIEFRHMEGHDNPEKLQEWLKTISNLIEVGRVTNVSTETLSKQGKERLFHAIFKDAPSILSKVALLDDLTFNSTLDLKLAI